MKNSELPYDGTLSLRFSCWPQTLSHVSSATSDEGGVDEEAVFKWLEEHVFCDDSSYFWNSSSIHLMNPLVFENVCRIFPTSREIDFGLDTIVWNMPEAEVDQTTLRGVGYDAFNYTIWNVSFPTYRIGDPETQRKLQRSFDLKLRNSYIAQDSLDGCRGVAVVGKEAEFWLVNRISQGEKDFLMMIGIILFGVQTIVLFFVPLVGKKLSPHRRKELLNASSEDESHSIDEMIITSKGFLDTELPHSNDVEKASPVGDVE